MNHIRKVAASSKKFVEDHRVAVAVTVTTLICVRLHVKTIADINTFLKEHNLFDKYYSTFEE